MGVIVVVLLVKKYVKKKEFHQKIVNVEKKVIIVLVKIQVNAKIVYTENVKQI